MKHKPKLKAGIIALISGITLSACHGAGSGSDATSTVQLNETKPQSSVSDGANRIKFTIPEPAERCNQTLATGLAEHVSLGEGFDPSTGMVYQNDFRNEDYFMRNDGTSGISGGGSDDLSYTNWSSAGVNQMRSTDAGKWMAEVSAKGGAFGITAAIKGSYTQQYNDTTSSNQIHKEAGVLGFTWYTLPSGGGNETSYNNQLTRQIILNANDYYKAHSADQKDTGLVKELNDIRSATTPYQKQSAINKFYNDHGTHVIVGVKRGFQGLTTYDLTRKLDSKVRGDGWSAGVGLDIMGFAGGDAKYGTEHNASFESGSWKVENVTCMQPDDKAVRQTIEAAMRATTDGLDINDMDKRAIEAAAKIPSSIQLPAVTPPPGSADWLKERMAGASSQKIYYDIAIESANNLYALIAENETNLDTMSDKTDVTNAYDDFKEKYKLLKNALLKFQPGGIYYGWGDKYEQDKIMYMRNMLTYIEKMLVLDAKGNPPKAGDASKDAVNFFTGALCSSLTSIQLFNNDNYKACIFAISEQAMGEAINKFDKDAKATSEAKSADTTFSPWLRKKLLEDPDRTWKNYAGLDFDKRTLVNGLGAEIPKGNWSVPIKTLIRSAIKDDFTQFEELMTLNGFTNIAKCAWLDDNLQKKYIQKDSKLIDDSNCQYIDGHVKIKPSAANNGLRHASKSGHATQISAHDEAYLEKVAAHKLQLEKIMATQRGLKNDVNAGRTLDVQIVPWSKIFPEEFSLLVGTTDDSTQVTLMSINRYIQDYMEFRKYLGLVASVNNYRKDDDGTEVNVGNLVDKLTVDMTRGVGAKLKQWIFAISQINSEGVIKGSVTPTGREYNTNMEADLLAISTSITDLLDSSDSLYKSAEHVAIESMGIESEIKPTGNLFSIVDSSNSKRYFGFPHWEEKATNPNGFVIGASHVADRYAISAGQHIPTSLVQLMSVNKRTILGTAIPLIRLDKNGAPINDRSKLLYAMTSFKEMLSESGGVRATLLDDGKIYNTPKETLGWNSYKDQIYNDSKNYVPNSTLCSTCSIKLTPLDVDTVSALQSEGERKGYTAFRMFNFY